MNATGRLRGRQRADRLQADLLPQGESVRIGPGSSGAAVWDPRHDVVVGMLVTRGRGVVPDTAYLVTMQAMQAVGVRWPACSAGPETDCPPESTSPATAVAGRSPPC
ncbi:hypothetical protein [Streptomyces sp. NPDC000351]|uniref:hypothetical protein n=1 Tax=Streptomyces sp. NPDC000351 TaxID=3154250 RepID=UPI003321FEE4